MKKSSLQNKKIIYKEETSKRFKGDKLFWWGLGIIFILIGGIFLFIIFYRLLWLGLPSHAIEDITPGLIVIFVGLGFIFMGVISIIMSYTMVDLTIFDDGMILPKRSFLKIIKKEIDFIPFSAIERIYLDINKLPLSAYLSKEQLLDHLPKSMSPSVKKEISDGKIKMLKTREGVEQPDEGDIVTSLKNGGYIIISEIDVENKDDFKNTLHKLGVSII